jgi:hypothetical protein
MTVRKRKNKKEFDKKKFWRYLIYILTFLIVGFLIYRIVILLSFRVNCSAISDSDLSNNSSIINTLFVFEEDEKIVNMEVVTYSKDQKNILRIPVPTSIYTTEEGVDSFPISSIYSVGEFFENGSGKGYTVEYMSDLLGLKFDNYVWLVNSSENTDEFLSKLSIWSTLFDFGYNRQLKGNLYSNLPILNLIKEVNFINQSLVNYQYEEMDILDCCIEKFIISGNREEVRFVVRNFDEQFTKYIDELVSKDVEKERVNVEVYNASNVLGLASRYARKIRHTGCRILRYDNAPNIYEKSTIYVPEPDNYQKSLDLIKDVVGEGVEVKYERPSFITTGDIVLVLGKDLG